MLLTISTTHKPATDLGYLLHKHPDRFQSFNLRFGWGHVFYPEANENRCTACLMLDVDPVEMARGRRRGGDSVLAHYVNDRPYVVSSFMSTAISQVFGTALAGRCRDRAELVEKPLPLEVAIEVLPVRGGAGFVQSVFEPLGYEVETQRHVLDEKFPEWGNSPYFSVRLKGNVTLSQLLNHLYVLIPVFDNQKHYFVSRDELDKLLAKGTGWLALHPEKEIITRRYLKFQPSLVRQALARLVEEDAAEDSMIDEQNQPEEELEKPLSLSDQRLGAVLAALRASGARRVVDFGCGEGKLLRELLKDKQFDKILGMDVSVRSLEIAGKRLKIDNLPSFQAQRIKLMHGSLMYRDKRLAGFEAASVVEVIEHFDPPRLSAFERVLFQHAKPETVVLTTPNAEYNVKWETLPAGIFRHSDHRFEWTRNEFQSWATGIGARFGYTVRFLPVGPDDEKVGSPTQMGVFERIEVEGRGVNKKPGVTAGSAVEDSE